MKKKILALTAMTVLAATTVFAQGRGNGNGNQPPAPGQGLGSQQGTGTPQVDVSQPVTVQGKVISFTASQGSGMPTLAVKDGSKDYTFVLGPYRYLTAQQFAAQAGDTVKVIYYVCTSCESGMAVAQAVNVTRNLTLNLRSADGVPLWRGPNGYKGHGKGQGHGNGRQGSCQGAGPDMARVAVVEGSVKSFEGGPGQGQPELVLATAAGDKAYRLSPYRVLASSGYLPAEGARLKLTVVPVLVDGVEEWVIVTLEDASSGFKLNFRDPQTGVPVGGRGRGRC